MYVFVDLFDSRYDASGRVREGQRGSERVRTGLYEMSVCVEVWWGRGRYCTDRVGVAVAVYNQTTTIYRQYRQYEYNLVLA